MANPVLLLSPDESRDASGPVTPTVTWSVSVVAGPYANAWDFSGGGVTFPHSGIINDTGGTLLLRAKAAETQGGTNAYMFYAGTFDCYMLNYGSATLRGKIGASSATTNHVGAIVHDAWAVYAMRWDGTQFWHSVDTTNYPSNAQEPFGSVTSTLAVGSNTSGSSPFTGQIEAMMLLDDEITDSELETTLDRAWAWDMFDTPDPTIPIKAKAGGVLVDVVGCKAKVGGSLVDVTVGG